MNSRRTLTNKQENTDINISPLIDMVFILLIFFIVTTVFVEERGLGVEKPDPVGTPTDADDNVVFTLTSNGEVLYAGKSLGMGGVAATVRDQIRRKMVPVIIKVEQGAIANLVVRVIDESRMAGAEKISLTSQE
jgi:biopolymer transport protein ExbD